MSAKSVQPMERTGLRRALMIWFLVFGVTSFILILGILPPFVDEPFRGFLMAGFRPFCHQLPTRSFYVDGIQIALCHRCLGIYTGIPIAVAGFMVLRRWDGFLDAQARFVVVASLVPLAVDWALDFTGIWHNTPISRLITGSLFGLVAGYYLATGIVKIGTSSRKHEVGIPTGNQIEHLASKS